MTDQTRVPTQGATPVQARDLPPSVTGLDEARRKAAEAARLAHTPNG